MELAGPPKQTARPIPSVSVGVTKTRTVLVASQVPRYPPADVGPQIPPPAHCTLTGYTLGRQQGEGPHEACCQVKAENIGSHSSTRSQSQIGIPNATGSDHGANGAQLSGKLIHDPPPNPQARPLKKSSAICSTFCSKSGLKSILKLRVPFSLN